MIRGKQIYIHNDSRIDNVSEDLQFIRIPKLLEPVDLCDYPHNGCISERPARMEYLELKKFKSSFHIPRDIVISRSLQEPRIAECFRQICALTNNELKYNQNQTMLELHPIILANCTMTVQWESDLFLFDLTWLAISKAAVVRLGRPVLESNVGNLINNIGNLAISREDYELQIQRQTHYAQEYHRLATMNSHGYPIDFFASKEKKYKDDAEENAHELLKNMIPKKDFERYKLEDYVIVKGTYGRTYRIQKGDMIEVTQKRAGKTKKYRLCIEPKHRGTICPTDEVICRIKLIKADEKLLHKTAYKFNNQGGII